MKRKIISLLLAACMLVGLVPVWQVDASAASYPAAYSTPSLTGNQAYDAASIAKSQIGYTTSTENYTVYTAEIGGVQGSAWCAYFVKWCLNKAGVTDYLSVSGGAGSTTSLWVYFNSMGSWHGNFNQAWSYGSKSGTNTKDSSYTPQIGDVVLFETNSSLSDGPDHTGIVVDVSGSSVTTVEGNIGTADKVATFTYDRWSSKIWGFGRPKYSGGSSGGGSSSSSSTLSLSNKTVPTAVKCGNAFSIYGTVSSNYKLNYVAVIIMDLDKNVILSKQAAPGTYSYNVHSLDDDIPFGQLASGTYYYQIEAKDASQNFQVLYYDQFVVYNDIGTDFYGVILNTAAWKCVRNSNGNAEIAAVESGKSKELWKFVRNSDGSYLILSALDGKALDADNYGTTDGTNVLCYNKVGDSNQRWWIISTSKGYLIRPAHTDKVLDMYNNETSDGTNIQLWSQNGTTAQYWSIYTLSDVQLASPTFSVAAGTPKSQTKFTWNDVPGETAYDIKIWNGTIWEGDAYYIKWGVDGLNWSTTLPAGYYEAYVDAYNYFERKMSNKVSFSIRPIITVTAGTDVSKTTYSWDAMNGAKQYTITIHSNSSGKDQTITTTETSGSITLGAGTYTIKVAGYDGTHTLTSDTVSFTVKNHTHSYNNGTITTTPTCTKTGIKTYTCTICKSTKTETVAATGHNYELKNAIAATCTTSGYTGDEICKSCGNVKSKGTTISATGHSWGNWVVTKNATETEQGVETRTCSVCKTQENRSIPTLAHTHNYQFSQTVAPTCTTAGYDLYRCSCDAEEKRNQRSATGHNYELRNAVAATCTSSGYSGDQICKNCGNVKSKGNTIPATGHSWGEWTVVIPATYLHSGTQTRICPICGASETQEISALSSPFVDVQNKNDYFYTPVLWAVENNITYGTDTTHFSPNQSCTRAQLVSFLWRAAGEPEPETTKSPFTDVQDPSEYYYKAVLWAAENGIAAGVGNNQFAPNQTCTRAQIVSFIYRASGDTETYTENPFQDVSPKDYYYKAVLWGAANGVVAGTSDTTFSPNQTCTRAQGVSFLYRSVGLY